MPQWTTFPVNVWLYYRFIFITTNDPHSTSLRCYDEDETYDRHHIERRDVGGYTYVNCDKIAILS